MTVGVTWSALIIALSLFSASCVYLFVGTITLLEDKGSKLRQLFFLSALFLNIWSAWYGGMTIVNDPTFIYQAWLVGFCACGAFFPLWLHYSFCLTNISPRVKEVFLCYAYLATPIILLWCLISGDVRFVITDFGNQFYYEPSAAFHTFVVHIVFLLTSSFVLHFYWLKNARLRQQRRRIIVFIVVMLLVAPPGLILEFFVPAFLQQPVPPLTSAIIIVCTLQLYYTIKANQGFSVTAVNTAPMIFSSVSIPIVLLNYKNEIELINTSAKNLLGAHYRTLLGYNFSKLIWVDDAHPPESFFTQSFEKEIVAVGFGEYRIACDMSLTIKTDKYGDILYKIVVVKDISDILNAMDKANEANEAKGRFLAKMSHEIRTPMNAIIGMSEILHEEPLNERQRGYISDIRSASSSLLSIINDILDFSKIESGKMTLAVTPLNLLELLDHISSTIQFACASKKLAFHFEPSSNLPDYIMGDASRLRQILLNLLGNAVKYTHQGSVTFSVAPRGECLVFTVADTGIGLRQEDIQRLFLPFEQADRVRNSNVVGTGLGLAITREFVEMMQGEITIESQYNVGSVFSVILPLVVAEGVEPETERDTGHLVYAPRAKVLVVDDNDINLNAARGLLALSHIHCDTAQSGEEALLLVQKADYDIVFMDHMMPGMDGVETTLRIRDLGGDYQNLVIIALTANAVKGVEELFLSATMNDFLFKPIDRRILSQKLSKWLPQALLHGAPPPREDALPEEDPLVIPSFPGVDTALGLQQVGGSPKVYLDTMKLFLQQLPGQLKELDELLSDGDEKGFRIRIHALKSAMASLGITQLAATAQRLETDFAGGFPQPCATVFRQLSHELTLLQAELAAFFREDCRPLPQGDALHLGTHVAEILATLQAFELGDSLERLAALSEKTYGSTIDEELKRARNLAEGYDLDGACLALEALLALTAPVPR